VRIALPLIGAAVCLELASQINVPIAGFALFVVGMGLVFDAGSVLFARVSSTGGMRDHKQ
jgi:hypothetical protein